MLTEVDDEWLNYVQVHLEDKVRQSYSITYRKHSLSHAPIHSNHLTYTLNTYLLMYCSTLVGWSDFDSNHTVVLPGVRSVPIGAFHQIIVRLTGQPLVGQIDLLFHLCIISTLVGWSDWFSYSSSVHIYIDFFIRKWNHRCCGTGFRTKICRLWDHWRFRLSLRPYVLESGSSAALCTGHHRSETDSHPGMGNTGEYLQSRWFLWDSFSIKRPAPPTLEVLMITRGRRLQRIADPFLGIAVLDQRDWLMFSPR